MVFDGTDCSTQMQAAIYAVVAAGGGVLRAPVGGIRATGLVWSSKVQFRGAFAQTIDSTSGTRLVGTAGSDTITFPPEQATRQFRTSHSPAVGIAWSSPGSITRTGFPGW